jgi:hypothetical protein
LNTDHQDRKHFNKSALLDGSPQMSIGWAMFFEILTVSVKHLREQYIVLLSKDLLIIMWLWARATKLSVPTIRFR